MPPSVIKPPFEQFGHSGPNIAGEAEPRSDRPKSLGFHVFRVIAPTTGTSQSGTRKGSIKSSVSGGAEERSVQ